MSLSQVMTKKLKELQYFPPTTVAEAASVLKDYDSRAKAVNGFHHLRTCF